MRGAWRMHNFFNEQKQKQRLRRAMKAIARFPNVDSSRLHGLDAPLVVTLTSYPPRFATLGMTLRSILDQTVRPDRTILWLTKNDLFYLPDEIHGLTAHGLEIRTCADLRSYKKLIPALEMFPDAWFVTADDDVYYPPGWLEDLVGQAERSTVVATRVHMAELDASGRFKPYSDWVMNTHHLRTDSPSARLFPTGVGGVLYPPNAFSKEVMDKDAFMRLCPYGDDIWFFWMARLAGCGHTRTRSGFDILAWPHSQDVGLFQENQINSRNDPQIRNMEQVFGPIP